MSMPTLRVYRWLPGECCIRVFERNHTDSRVLSYHNHTRSQWSSYGMAQAILKDFRGHERAAEYWRTFGDEKIARLNMNMRWELSGEEISAWLGSKEVLNVK